MQECEGALTSSDPLKMSLKKTEEEISVLQGALEWEKDNLRAEIDKMSKDHVEAPVNGESIMKLEEARDTSEVSNNNINNAY